MPLSLQCLCTSLASRMSHRYRQMSRAHTHGGAGILNLVKRPGVPRVCTYVWQYIQSYMPLHTAQSPKHPQRWHTLGFPTNRPITARRELFHHKPTERKFDLMVVHWAPYFVDTHTMPSLGRVMMHRDATYICSIYHPSSLLVQDRDKLLTIRRLQPSRRNVGRELYIKGLGWGVFGTSVPLQEQ